MDNKNAAYTDIDTYIRLFPADVQDRLHALRAVIKEEAPEALEKISYGMPTFAQYGNICHFAAFKNHIGFFPGANGIAMFLSEMSGYVTSKGTVQFPYATPMPFDLVRRIVRFRLAENKEWEKQRVNAQKAKRSGK
jgi:uncharacterized protein YdhG (YjbR/CyaY superfamily)